MSEYDFIIIDPASPEFNRGSFCYSPYILYSALKAGGQSGLFYEDFSCTQIDLLPKAKKYFVGLWSYPQIDACRVLNRYLPSDSEVYFFGYTPLIEHERLPSFVLPPELIKTGIKEYVDYYNDFSYILLSDCDMHLTKYSGQVYPLFTSYGCSNRCRFCPVSVNCDSYRVVLTEDEVLKSFEKCDSYGYKNIHLTDEDFFFDIERANRILQGLVGKGFNLIVLGSVHTVLRFVRQYGSHLLEDAGIKLIEVGLESADPKLNKAMGKHGLENYLHLAEVMKGTNVNIFWLTMTFFPGETIQSLRQTGLFLKKYGYELHELYGRIATNSTEGGLGQFFQLYHGVRGEEELRASGQSISSRPVRLLPSFIPHSFLNSKIENVRQLKEDDRQWYEIYKVDPWKFYVRGGESVKEVIQRHQGISIGETATFLAISSRIGVIE